MKMCRLIYVLIIRLTVLVLQSQAGACEFSANRSLGNETRWEILEAVSNRVHLDDDVMVKDSEYYRYYLWGLFQASLTLRRPKHVDEIRETLKDIAYRDCRVDMMLLILFGPVEAQSILQARLDYEKLGGDISQCVITANEFFTKHCGPDTENGMKHGYSVMKMCMYVKEKTSIEDAIIAVCAFNTIAPYGLDVENPSIDVAPAPIHGSSETCGRTYINRVSRLHFKNYGKVYWVMLDSAGLQPLNTVQVCVHRNPSLGLCRCEKDDWSFIENVPRVISLSPYEQWFVDVKFGSAVNGYVTVTLKEDPHRQSRCQFLAMGVGALFVAGSRELLNEKYNDEDWIAILVLRVLAVLAIYTSSFDTPMAMIAVASSLTLYYVISSIVASTREEWEKFRGKWTRDLVTRWVSTPGFRDWVIKNHNRITVN